MLTGADPLAAKVRGGGTKGEAVVVSLHLQPAAVTAAETTVLSEVQFQWILVAMSCCMVECHRASMYKRHLAFCAELALWPVLFVVPHVSSQM